jgi:hypothetical protein
MDGRHLAIGNDDRSAMPHRRRCPDYCLKTQKDTLLIVREAFWGKTRCSEFRQELRVAPNILSNRLAHLVDEGIPERQDYQEEHGRRVANQSAVVHPAPYL